MRAAFIGSGNIANMHVPAFRTAGFEITAVCGRPGSKRAQEFAERHNIPHVFQTAADLLAARDLWDALLIAVDVDETVGVLTTAMETGAPILVEKPVAFTSRLVRPLLNRSDRVLVAYNRRFYDTVAFAREEVQQLKVPLLAQLQLPENIRFPKSPEDDPQYLRPFFDNSVHGLDMARFIFGDLQVLHAERVYSSTGVIRGICATLKALESGSLVHFMGNWGSSANFSFTMHTEGRRLELLPFERATVYEGMDVMEPTDDVPIRSYWPRVKERVLPAGRDVTHKPGFVQQAAAFAALAHGETPKHAATLEDAHEVLQLAEELAGVTLD